MVLFGTDTEIKSAVNQCIEEGVDILNVGNGVIQGTPEEAVGTLFDHVKSFEKVHT